LARVRDAECVIGAASRDQATILFNQAAGLVRRSAIAHEFDIRTGYREIRLAGEKMGARVRVLAADAATADGVIPTLALVDELHRHPSSALYGVFRDGLGPRDGQMVTISTAGATQKSPLGEVRALARAMDGFTREGAHQYVKSPDGGFVLHEWSLEDEAEADDIEKVKGANPAPWQTVEALRQRFESPSTSKWQWFRFACGIWTEGEEPWLDPAKWDSLTDLSAEGTSESIVGVRVGHKHLTAALVLASRAGLGRWKIEAEIFDKLGEEDAPLAFLEDRIRELCDQRPISTVVYWSSAFQRSADLLEADGVPILEIPFRPNRVMDASETLLKVIEERRIAHDGDRGLRSSVLSGKVKMTEGGWRFVDNPEGSSPDALLAMAAAVHIGETQYTGDPQVAVL
jgi:phage terminase large subunit-like protein